MGVIGDQKAPVYEEDGRDVASGNTYKVSVTESEADPDPATAPRHDCVRVRFKYEFLPGDRPASRFTFDLNRGLSRKLRPSLDTMVSDYCIPSDAYNNTMEFLSSRYGSPSPTDPKDIRASILVNYAPDRADSAPRSTSSWEISLPISDDDDDVDFDDDDDDYDYDYYDDEEDEEVEDL